MPIFMLLSPTTVNYFLSLIAPLRWWSSWKMAAILKFQVAVGSLLSSDHQRHFHACIIN